ncbi:MAG: hypothetical protein ACFFFC_13840 [Candidatus Thorarchaeota archaeon]
MPRLRSTMENAKEVKCEEVKKHHSTEGHVLVLRKEAVRGFVVRPIERSYMRNIVVRRKPRRLREYLDKGVTRWA